MLIIQTGLISGYGRLTFSADGLVDNLQASFAQTGFDDLFAFVLRHRSARRWIVASDFNLGSLDAVHNVYAFAAYPMGERGYFEIMDRLRKAVPGDFKRTRVITEDIERFFQGDDCFCFVILAPTSRMFFRDHVEHSANLQDAIEQMEEMVQAMSQRDPYDSMLADMRRLCFESRKRSFSLTLLENILIFAVANAFVSYNVASIFGADQVSWFPDRDNMTTYSDSAWAGLAHANFHGMWSSRLHRQSPNVGMIDHRVRGTNDLYDPLIRVPDFLAATTSRWHLERNALEIPDGTSRGGRRRYRQIIRAWAADNPNLWIGRIFIDEDGLIRCARIAVTRTRRRAERLRALRQ